eukprot:3758584-Pyramimonas_sp.AAC.1
MSDLDKFNSCAHVCKVEGSTEYKSAREKQQGAREEKSNIQPNVHLVAKVARPREKANNEVVNAKLAVEKLQKQLEEARRGAG